MSTIERVLLIINRAAGVGHDAALVNRLRVMMADSLADKVVQQVAVVGDHPAARACASEFLKESAGPAFIIAGGGGGTLRAVIEGICESSNENGLPGAGRVRVGALRMGSGNLLAKQFGISCDPEDALRGLLVNLKAEKTVPCCLIRCEARAKDGKSEVHYATSLGGFGQFGRTPGDLAKWHKRVRILRERAARLVQLERLNDMEYMAAMLMRSIACALFPGRVETVWINASGRAEKMRLLSGVVMNFPVRALPFCPGVHVEEEAISIHLFPYAGRLSPFLQLLSTRRLLRRARHIRLERGTRLEMCFAGNDVTEFFLDEDPVMAYGRITLEVAGPLAFVPGPDYPHINGREVFV